MSAIDEYLLTGSPEESNWRSVILFGRNAASYKFALAQALIDLAKQNKDSVTLDQLADPYTRHLCEHLAHSPKQSTSRSSKFIDACSGFNNGEVTHDALISTAVQLGFNNVLDAFHVVNQGDVPVKFFEKDFSRGSRRLILTDEVFKLANSDEAGNIIQETESRWNLVETAWEQGISSSLLRISYDDLGQALVAESGTRRKDVTSARGSLNGYQKGHCFYCYVPIDAADGTARTEGGLILPESAKPGLCDVDHFFPHACRPRCPVSTGTACGTWCWRAPTATAARAASSPASRRPNIYSGSTGATSTSSAATTPCARRSSHRPGRRRSCAGNT